jgi:hypothetical protein
MSTQTSSPQPIRRLTRLEQLTLNTWRWAAVTLQNTLAPPAVLEEAALHAVLAALRDVENPVDLFARHAHGQPEFHLIQSELADDHRPGLPHDILDTAFLLRWTELAVTGVTPQESKPLPPAKAPEPRALE